MKRIALTIATVLCVSTWIFAQDKSKPTPTDKPLQPTVIEAERSRSETNDGESYLIFSGSVKLTGTNLVITCNQLEVFARTKENEEDEEAAIGAFSSIQRILATGNVRIVQEERTATAGRLEVLPNEEVIILTEDPMLFQDGNTAGGKGTELRFYSGKGRVEWTGGADNKVKFTGPPIQDLGFEDDGKTIVPEEEEKEKPAADAKDEEPKADEKSPTDSPEKTPKKDAK
ncbi:MAG: LptA/OstA family protein [Verrucomicrobiia bacterium]